MGGCASKKQEQPAEPPKPQPYPPIRDDIDIAFRKADKDGDGSIDVHELDRAMAMLGVPANSFQLTLETMRRYDRDGDERLGEDEFRVLAQEVQRFSLDADESFAKYDADCNGRIDVLELYEALSALGLADSVAHAEQVMAKFSVEQSPRGTLQIDEYKKVVEKCRSFQRHKAAFRRFDTDANGSLDRNELFSALQELGLMGSHEQVKQVFKRFDADHDGSLALPEFIKLADAVGTCKQFDKDARGSINVQELHYALQTLKLAPAEAWSFHKTSETFYRYDVDHDGLLQLCEYLTLVDEMKETRLKEAQLREAAYANGAFVAPSNHPKPPPLPPAAQPQPVFHQPHQPHQPQPQPLPLLPPQSLPQPQYGQPLRKTLQPIAQPRLHPPPPYTPQHSQHQQPLHVLQPSVRVQQPDENRPPAPPHAQKKRVTLLDSRDGADDVEVAFRRADSDGNGSIDVHELMAAMATLGIPPSGLEQAVETMRRFDRDGDGALQLPEFRELSSEVARWRRAAAR